METVSFVDWNECDHQSLSGSLGRHDPSIEAEERRTQALPLELEATLKKGESEEELSAEREKVSKSGNEELYKEKERFEVLARNTEAKRDQLLEKVSQIGYEAKDELRMKEEAISQLEQQQEVPHMWLLAAETHLQEVKVDAGYSEWKAAQIDDSALEMAKEIQNLQKQLRSLNEDNQNLKKKIDVLSGGKEKIEDEKEESKREKVKIEVGKLNKEKEKIEKENEVLKKNWEKIKKEIEVLKKEKEKIEKENVEVKRQLNDARELNNSRNLEITSESGMQDVIEVIVNNDIKDEKDKQLEGGDPSHCKDGRRCPRATTIVASTGALIATTFILYKLTEFS